MNFPQPGDLIDIHNHGAAPVGGQFSIENLMAHEDRIPDQTPGLAYSIGIHPWHLTKETLDDQLIKVIRYAGHSNVIALGEAGFDRLRGPETELQKDTFEKQVKIADLNSKPLFIHCVRAWDELLAEHKRLRPSTPWLIHGFRGKRELAGQLLSRGMFISFWFDFILRPESSPLVRSMPIEKIFFETDGSGAEIGTIYNKVASDLSIDIIHLKNQILSNYMLLFKG
jgi:TatD DNase family protein